jgi:hypothetical protein
MRSAEIHLPYFKQGDDLGHFLENSDNIGVALMAHAEMLKEASNILVSVKYIVDGHNVKVDADTHMIFIEGPDEVIQRLIDGGYASPSDFEGEDDI